MKTIALLIELRHAFEKMLGRLTREAGVLYTTPENSRKSQWATEEKSSSSVSERSRNDPWSAVRAGGGRWRG